MRSARRVGRAKQLSWQGVLGGAEYRHYWKSPQRLGDYPHATSYASDQALQALASDVRRWLAHDYRFERAEVEAALQKIHGGDGGALYKSVVLQAVYLERIDAAVQQRLQAGPEELLAGAEPEAFGRWREQRDRLMAKGLRAPRAHVEALLPVMRQCGLAPQAQAKVPGRI